MQQTATDRTNGKATQQQTVATSLQPAVYRACPLKRKRRTAAEVEALDLAIYNALENLNPMTLRQLFYKLVTTGVIEKTEAQYDAVGRRLKILREGDVVPWEWIEDYGRWMRKPRTYESMEEALRHTAQTYRRALWTDNPAYVEIWLEKAALAGIIAGVTAQYDVPLMPCGGFSSISFIHNTAMQMVEYDKVAHIYYFGDHDPSGVHIDRSIENSLRKYAPDADIRFERVAVQEWQIAEWNLPTRPTKQSDSRAKNFNGDSVELDAIPPETLCRLVEDCITRHVSVELLQELEQTERMERETLQRIAESFA